MKPRATLALRASGWKNLDAFTQEDFEEEACC
jgi:hypothetical protein